MNCNLSLASVSLLQEKGIIDENNVLAPTDIPLFNKENLRQQQSARQHYGYTGQELPFKYIATVVENEPAFVVVLNQKFIEAVEQLDRVSGVIKPGVPELFESNPELANAVYEALGFKEQLFSKQDVLKLYDNEFSDFTVLSQTPYLKDLNSLDIRSEGYVIGEDTYKRFKDENSILDAYDKGEISKDDVNEALKNAPYIYKKNNKTITQEEFDFNRKIGTQVLIQYGNSKSTFIVSSDGTLIEGKNKVKGTKSEITPQQKQQAQQLYSQYLDTIFPDSKVKDIVYHGSIYKNKQRFEKSTRVSGHYFATTPQEALQHAQRQLTKPEDASLYRILLNIKNPRIISKVIDYEDLDTEVSFTIGDELFYDGADGVIAEKVEEYNTTYKTPESTWIEKQIIAFEPEQIHILGNQEDIEGFKEFVTQRQGETFFQVESTGKAPAIRQSTASEEALNKVKELLAKLGVQVRPDFTLEGTSIAGVARTLNDIYNIVYGEVSFAPSKENRVLVEEAFHLIEAMLPTELRNALLADITNYRIYQETLEVYKYMTEYQLADGTPNIPKIKREAVGKLLAEYYIGLYDKKTVNNQRLGNIFNRIWEWVKSLVSNNLYKQTVQDLVNEQFNLNALELQDDLFQVDPDYISEAEKSFTPAMEAQLREVSLKIQPILKKMEFSLSKVGAGADWLKTINDAVKEGHLNALTEHLTKVFNYLDNVERFTGDLKKFVKNMTDVAKVTVTQQGTQTSVDWTVNLSPEKKMALMRDYHFLNNVINHLKNIVEEYNQALAAERLPSNDWLRVTIDNIESNLLSVNNSINEKGIKQIIASILEDQLSDGMKLLTIEFDEQLRWVTRELDTIAQIEVRRPLDKKEAAKKAYLNKLENDIEQKKKKRLPTKENILKALTDNSDPRSPFYAMVQFFMRTDEFHSEALTAAVTGFIKDSLRAVSAERENIASEMASILDELVYERGFYEDPDKQYKGFFRDTTALKFVEKIVTDKNGKTKHVGELLEYPVKVLNGDFDNIRFNNDIESLKYKIYQEESKDIQDFDLIENLKKQLEDLLMLAERKYTPEYYAISQILTDEDRTIIESLYQERKMLERFGNYEDINEESLVRIEEIDREIARLSSLTDTNGEPLPEGPLLDRAKRFKAYREAVQENEVYIYETSQDALDAFEARKKIIDARYKEAQLKFGNGKISVEEYDAEVKARDDWYYFNSRMVTSQEFYIQRQEILDDIDAVLAPYVGANKEAVSDLYAQIFNMTRGYRDPNGIYRADEMPEELRAKVKELQVKIQDLRELPEIPEDVQAEVDFLFEELAQIQKSENTVYWDIAIEEMIEHEVDLLETEFIQNFVGTQEQINQEAGRRRRVFFNKAKTIVENSDWYLNNTIETTFTDADGEEITKRIPILVWRRTTPRDSSFVKIEPAKAYSTRQVNPKFLNPNYREEIPYKTTTDAAYTNTDVDFRSLNPKEREILERYKEKYFEYQLNNPYNGRLGEVLPFIHKAGLDVTIDWAKSIGELFYGGKRIKERVGRFFNPLKIFWRRHVSLKDDDEEIEGSVKERDYKDRQQEYYRNSIYIPYITPFKYAGEISSDITESIAAYGMEAAKTQLLFRINPIAASVGEIVSKNPYAARGLKKTVEHTYRKEFLGERSVIRKPGFGKTRLGNALSGLVAGLQKVIISRMGAVRKNVMAFNFSSETANAANNIYQILINNNIYNVSPKDLKKAAMLAGKKMLTDKGDILSVGRSKEAMRALRYFGSVGQEESTGQLAGKITTSWWRKWANTDVIYRKREIEELFYSLTLMYAMGKHVLVELNDNYVPIYEAFEIRDNKYVPKKGAIIPEKVLTHFRRNLNKMSVDLRGAYGTNAPHAGKFFFGKMVLFLKGFFIPQMMRRYFTDINYGTGTINYATANTFYRELVNMWRYRHFAEYEMTDNQKKAFRAGMKESIWLLTNYALLATYFAMGTDDEEDDDIMSYIIYMWKRIFGETDTFSPMALVNYTLARIHEPQRSGTSSTGSSFSDAAYNFGTKMFDDMLISPVTGRHGIEGLGLMLDVPHWTDPYYGKYYKRGHGADSKYPQFDKERANAMMPFQSGMPRLIVGLMKFYNQSAPVVLYPSKANEAFNLYNYNLYMLPSEPLFIKKKKAK